MTHSAVGWRSPRAPWRAGRFSAEVRGDEIADVRVGATVVLRSVRAVARDRDWGTVESRVRSRRLDGSSLEIAADSASDGCDLTWTLRVEADGGELRARCRFETSRGWWTARTGLTVLHPPDCAGRELLVRHTDGHREETRFPTTPAPHQPAIDFRGLTWSVGGLTVDAEFRGDVFEMEDQRNWTDASFKTYSRPLSLPFPYRLEPGSSLEQSLTLRVGGTGPSWHRSRPSFVSLRPGGRFPAIRTGASTAPDPAPETDGTGDALTVEVDVSAPTRDAALARAARTGLPLDVRLTLDPDDEMLPGLAAALARLPIASIGAYRRTGESAHTSDAEVVAAARLALGSLLERAPLLGGSRAHYTELNRMRDRLSSDLDGITCSLTPLFHSVTGEQLVESVSMQRLVAEQVIGVGGGLPVHLGPVTLRPRFNDVATGALPDETRSDLSDGYGAEHLGGVDARQASDELAAWTVASAAALALPGVASITWFEQWGRRGVRTAEGDDLPAAAALRTLSARSGGGLFSGDSPDGLIWACGSRSGGSVSVLAASLDHRERSVEVEIDGSTRRFELPGWGWAADSFDP